MLFGACGQQPYHSSLDHEGAVTFRINEAAPPNSDTLKVTAQWTEHEQVTQFDIVLLTPPLTADQPFTFSKGWLIARAPSQSRAFVSRIAAIHGVPDRYPAPQPVDSLFFSAAILGQALSRGVDENNMVAGGFRPDPPGPWMSAKLFFGDGEIEIYLNINRKDGVAEFSVKDPTYGRDLLPILASVLEAP